MKTLVSHPTGNRNVRAVLAALDGAGRLASFHGALALGRTSRWPCYFPQRLRAELERRRYDLPDALVRVHPWREIVRLAATRLGWTSLVARERGWACVDRVYAGLDRAVASGLRANGPTQAVYAYEDGALATFTRATELGIARVYDLPIAYWETGRRLMTEEAERLPAWAATLGGGVKDSPAKLRRKTRELELANLVVTPSQFVSDSLPKWARESKRVIISPFGSPEPLDEKLLAKSLELRAQSSADHNSDPIASRPSPFAPSTRLRVLFAGSLGQRKGLGDLFAAMRLLNRKDVELVVMGSLQAPMEFYRNEFADFTYEPGRPHAQVLELMRSCDVFCLPSIVEGRALVMQEAMSQGLPIIITPNTGGADLVCEARQIEAKSLELRAESSESEAAEAYSFKLTANSSAQPFGRSATGFLVPIRSPEAIAEAIAWCADHRAKTAEMGRAARLKAATYSWVDYGEIVVTAIDQCVKTLIVSS